MYPNLYYVFKDWFGVEWKALAFLNTFGLMVAIGFVVAAFFISQELKRKEKLGLLHPREELIYVGKPASVIDLLINFILGFIFGYKLSGLFFGIPEGMSPQEFIFSSEGNVLGGIVLGSVLAFSKWYEKNKQKLKVPEQRSIRIWPHDRVGDIVIIALVSGIIGAKLFDNFENWDEFIAHPIERLFSASGLTFYGGLILATISLLWYGKRKGINLFHLADAIAPAMLIAYAVGRIGCQVSGDGDWGIYNSAYITDSDGKLVEAKAGDFNTQLKKYDTYFLKGAVTDSSGMTHYVTDRVSKTLEEVPNMSVVAPSFLPLWMVAYNYPNNVNNDGIALSNCEGDYCGVLPVAVFPTPFYETVLSTLLFLFVWSIRKRIKTPGYIFSIYLILNGLERFIIEKIRVNFRYNVLGFNLSQAEIIALLLILAGIILMFIFKKRQNYLTE